MIIKIDSGGHISTVPSSVPMGTIMKEVLIIGPAYSATAVLRVKPPYQERLPDIICEPSINDANFVVFSARLPAAVTRWAGRVGYQVIYTDASGEVQATFSGTFNVQDGVPVENPESVEDLGDYSMEDLYKLLTNATLLHNRITELNALVGLGEELETEKQSVIAAINELFSSVEDMDASKLANRVETLEKQVAALSDEALAFTAASISPSVVEIGTAVPSVAIKWTLNKTPQRLYVNGVDTPPNTTAKSVVGPFVKDTDFTIKATFEKGEQAMRTVSLRFLRSVYFGAAEAPREYTSDFVLSLTANLRTDRKRTFTVDAKDDQYIYFCSPVAYGECTFTMDGFVGGFELAKMMDVTNASGHLETYYIYKSEQPNLGKCTVAVS